MIYKRKQFLRRLKEIKDKTGQNKDMYELGKELNFDKELTYFIVFYLRHKGLVEYHGLGSIIKITERGKERVERSYGNE